MNVWERFGGRRFVMTMGCALACTALVARGDISDVIFRDIIIATVAAYIAGNTSQKVFGARKVEPEEKP